MHYFLNDRHLVEKGLTNYWGYNTLGFFAPVNRYAAPLSAQDVGPSIQDDGGGAARCRHRGDSGCRVQPHRGGKSNGADAFTCAASITRRITN